jgi:hypothetical protein
MMIIKIMKRHWQYKVYLVLMALLLCHVTIAQETKLSKSINKTFKVSDRLDLEIINKYGNVIIETWPKNEVSLKIEILAYGKDENAADKLMDRVEFDFKQSDDFLEIESVFDRKKSFFKDLINTVGDYSASLMSKHKLQVNYELMIPETAASITIDNRFGDIHMGDVRARLNIKLSHGNFRANKIEDYSKVTVNYGKAKIKEIIELSMSLKGAELELEKAVNLKLLSSSSVINIEKVGVLDLESTNDKIIINELDDISGDVNFSEISISLLVESCRLNQSYGELSIKNVLDGFQSIRLNGKSTDYKLIFSKNSNFETNIYARDDKLSISDFAGKREKRYMDDKSKFVRLTGPFGSGKDGRKLTINAQNGEVKIDFNDTLPETYNK